MPTCPRCAVVRTIHCWQCDIKVPVNLLSFFEIFLKKNLSYQICIMTAIVLSLFCSISESKAGDTDIIKADRVDLNNISFLESKSKIDSLIKVLGGSITTEVNAERLEKVGENIIASIKVKWSCNREILMQSANLLENLCFESRDGFRKSVKKSDVGIFNCVFRNKTYNQELYSYLYNYRIWIKINTASSTRVIPVLAYRTMLFKNKSNILEILKVPETDTIFISSSIIISAGEY